MEVSGGLLALLRHLQSSQEKRRNHDKEMSFGIKQSWIDQWTLLLPNNGIWGKSLNVSELVSPHLKNEDRDLFFPVI